MAILPAVGHSSCWAMAKQPALSPKPTAAGSAPPTVIIGMPIGRTDNTGSPAGGRRPRNRLMPLPWATCANNFVALLAAAEANLPASPQRQRGSVSRLCEVRSLAGGQPWVRQRIPRKASECSLAGAAGSCCRRRLGTFQSAARLIALTTAGAETRHSVCVSLPVSLPWSQCCGNETANRSTGGGLFRGRRWIPALPTQSGRPFP